MVEMTETENFYARLASAIRAEERQMARAGTKPGGDRRICAMCGHGPGASKPGGHDVCLCGLFAYKTPNMETLEASILKFATEQWGEKTLERLANKLAEETGEIAGAVVKMPEGRATDADLDAELGDALIVLAQFAAVRGTTLQELLQNRFRQIMIRAGRAAP